MIKRAVEKKIKQSMKKMPVIAVTGCRQSGKTTLVKKLFPKMNYVNLERHEICEYAVNDPYGFLNTYKKGLIIDEAQRAPELFSYIQVKVDEENKEGMYVLSGSQNFLLMQNISQSLAGRVALFNLLPFSIQELNKTKYSTDNLTDYMIKGFFPRIYDKDLNPIEWYFDYVKTYIERDVRLIKNITSLTDFRKFIKMCANRTGQLLNISSLANDCGLSRITVKSWLSILEASYIIYFIQPYYRNYNKRIVKTSKLYFYDSGLLCSLLGITTKEEYEYHYLKGSIFESFIMSEILKYKFNHKKNFNCYFWRDKLGREIDCIIEAGNRIYAVEIKSGQTISSDYFNGLKYWNALSKQNLENSYVIYSGDLTQKRKYGNVINWKKMDTLFKLL